MGDDLGQTSPRRLLRTSELRRARRESGADGPEFPGEPYPVPRPRVVSRKVDHDASDAALDAPADFQEHQAQPLHLGTHAAAAGDPAAELLQQHVGGEGQQQPELVGGERKVGSKKVNMPGIMKLPNLPCDEYNHQKYQEFAVRIIGRLVFCWFLKKKSSTSGIPLIDDAYLSSQSVENNYYHTVLEHLFFQVLNTPMDERANFLADYFKHTPFLNGGLFEPHGDDFYKPDQSLVSRHLNTLKVPDEWFKKLFEVFETYNFTIDENTTIDIELSIDPEMLGRIFENLLAEINPETGETARKATGSYYTPRPIVEYMVDESLKQYLKTQTGGYGVVLIVCCPHLRKLRQVSF